MFDEQAAELLASTDDIAERVRKIGGTTLRSIGHIARQQRIFDNDVDYVTPEDMLAELAEDNRNAGTGFRPYLLRSNRRRGFRPHPIRLRHRSVA